MRWETPRRQRRHLHQTSRLGHRSCRYRHLQTPRRQHPQTRITSQIDVVLDDCSRLQLLNKKERYQFRQAELQDRLAFIYSLLHQRSGSPTKGPEPPDG
jgi:hypothetical protein